MSNNNSNLHAAKHEKNDEFYTREQDIEAELYWYKKHFKDKVIYLPCDDPSFSKFWWYFHMQFNFLGLKKLICTHYVSDGATYVAEYNGGNDTDITVMNARQLEGNGDFRNKECLDIMDESDIVITNPPFSLFREFVAAIEQRGKKYLIIGSQNAFTYKDIFHLIKDNKLWIGYNMVKEFTQPDGSIKKFGNICWFTNIDIPKRHDNIITESRYDAEKYPTYDNYPAIECSKVSNVPGDYDGVIGVPITFLNVYNPDQFDIIGLMSGAKGEGLTNGNDGRPKFYVNGKGVYARILIKRKQEN